MNVNDLARDAILQGRSERQDQEVARIKKKLKQLRDGKPAARGSEGGPTPFYIAIPPFGTSKQGIAAHVNECLSEYERFYAPLRERAM